jgi:hypothetical protein
MALPPGVGVVQPTAALGDQQTAEHLAEAVYDGPLADFLRSRFPK